MTPDSSAAVVEDRQPPPAVNYGDPKLDFVSALGIFLVDQKIIDRTVLDRAGSAARKTGERFDRVLTKLGLISEADLAMALSKFLSIPLVAPADVPMEPVLTDLIDANFVRNNKIVPLVVDDQAITVGTTDPFNHEPFNAMGYLTGLTVHVRIFIPADFDLGI
jgi:general secretion pathway protein E